MSIELVGQYKKGKGSIDNYLSQTAIANPHVKMTWHGPNEKEPMVYERATKILPVPPKEIKPHPHGIELGLLIKMLQDTKETTMASFLQNEFSRVGPKVAQNILTAAGLRPRSRPKSIARADVESVSTNRISWL